MTRIKCKTREEWLNCRAKQGIGASEAAAAVGLSPWMTQTELWQLKTGLVQPKDISDNEAVSRGVMYEPALRGMYMAGHPEYQLEHHPFDMLYQKERPWLFCTLDGEVTDAAGRKGILEIKTASPVGRAWTAWEGKIPDHYLCQVTSQLISTGYDFADLYAGLWDTNRNEIIIREYHLEREQCQADIDWLTAELEKFWESVQKKQMPKVKLSI